MPDLTAAEQAAAEDILDHNDRVRAKLSDRHPRTAGRLGGLQEAARIVRAAARQSGEGQTNG